MAFFHHGDSAGAGIIHKLKDGGLSCLFDQKNITKELVVDADSYTVKTEGDIKFIRFKSRQGGFASDPNKVNYTTRLEILKTVSNKNSITGIANAIRQGYLCSPQDFKNIEMTAIVRPVGIKQDDEAFTFKPRGAEHDDIPEKSLCFGVMVPYKDKIPHGGKLYEQELTHNDYKFFEPQFISPAPNNGENWTLIKLVAYNVPPDNPASNKASLYIEVYYSKTPFRPDGRIDNDHHHLYYIYTDKSDVAPVWGGKLETLRVDMVEFLDVAYFSCYEISAPNAVPDHPCGPQQHWDEQLQKCVENTPPPIGGDKDEHGTLMLKPITGKRVPMNVGGDPAGNGQRYNCNHKYNNYMMIGYFRTDKSQEKIEMKTDGPNHGSCTSIPQCMWYEPSIVCKTGAIEFGSEWPHPDNHQGLRMDYHKDVDGGIQDQWLGYCVIVGDSEQGQRVIEQWHCKNPFDVNGKPTNQWEMNMQSTETGDGKMFPTKVGSKTITFPRKLPVDFDQGLEAEIRMHKESGSTVEMKWAYVYELQAPFKPTKILS